ncbi:VOC family protein [Streptomyces bacillaris]|uniref:VOC family protein n=1 Tax=Streptomyces cavourensis TaxID=67258 RepID=A0ABY5F837_9ACTN|nr:MULTISPECIES: VOC family protein [Streptomyces]NUV38858.1 VOC family protein [Streptomyces sp. CAI-24]NUV81016.1 VOC family protein [Streptomyces sp. CAI-155]UTR79846.1 VOC family protein [Streptomyces cavourensis]WAE70094.1 VOC family protein [Streptomyces cavourensis]
MTSQLFAICFRSPRPSEPARFWSEVLGWRPAEGTDGGPAEDVVLLPPDGAGFRIRFLPGQEPKTGENRAHFDLTSTSPEDQRATVARALEHGGRHIDVGQTPDEGHVVLADPDGNEFCVIEPGNKFLADTGLIGALACDGTQEVGYFWSRALGWPLVWDQDEETAIQSPDGGTKITWGGPPVAPKTGVNRLFFELVLPDGVGLEAECERLVSLGATRPGSGAGDGGDGGVLMLDPDGNEFTVREPQPHF